MPAEMGGKVGGWVEGGYTETQVIPSSLHADDDWTRLGVGVGGPPTPTSPSSLQLSTGERRSGLGWGGSSRFSQQLSTPTPPLLYHSFWMEQFGGGGKKGGCHRRLQIPPALLPPGALPAGPIRGRSEAPSPAASRGRLLVAPWLQLARLLANGRQGLVTGTVVPAAFLGTQGEGQCQSISPKPPKPGPAS